MVPFTTRCETWISPSMRACSLTTSVDGSSGNAVTLPLISPSTRRPPEKVTFPSMRVPDPIRLSMLLCGLLGCLLNMIPSPCCLREFRHLDGPRLAVALLQNAHLHRLEPHFLGHPEGALDPLEVFEIQFECGALGAA